MRKLYLILTIGFLAFTPNRVFDNTAATLPFAQNWTVTTLITGNDDWSGVPSIEGFRGDDITTVTGVDPQTLLGEGTITLDVNANQTNPNTYTTGGVAEFEIADPVVALQGSGTADAPNIVMYLNTTGLQNITVAYNVRDIDGSTDNSIQPVALQYRVGSTGNFTNVPAGYIADATTGPSLATQVTPINAVLPAACDNQAVVQVRVITSNALGNDEWVGIDDINITGTPGTFNSANSDIIYNSGFTAPANVDYSLYQAADISFANSIEVAQLTIRDGGGSADGDAVGTTLTDLTMSLTNAANIRRVALYDGSTELDEVAGGASVSFSGLTAAAADDGVTTISVRVTYNTAVTDNQQYVFAVTSATASASGSTFAAGNAGGATSSSAGDDNRIEVTADRLAYVQNTTSPTGLNVIMAPSVTVSATDMNANLDLDFTSQVRITSTGTLAGTPVDVAAVAGVATFATLTHTVTGTGLLLTAERTATLDWDVVSNPFDILIASSATDYFRSVATGNWNVATTWESSADNITYIPATISPDFNANTIFIRNGHTVTANTAITVDQVDIMSGGVLVNQMPLNTGITFNNGSGDDMTIRDGGMYQLIPVDDYIDYNIVQAGATIHIEGNGVIRVGDGGTIGGGSNHNSFAATATSYIWDDGSIFDWNSLGFPGTSGVTFFPDANASTIPVLRFTVAPTTSFGGGSALTVNGVLEANDDVYFSGNGNKIFRNGITGTDSVTLVTASTGRIIVNGTTAIFGGAGIIDPNANGLEIGSGTTVTMLSAKTVAGDINLLSNGYIDLGTYNLTVTGNVTGGSTTSYIRTASTGALILNSVDATGKTFPVGHTQYNPIVIANGSDHNWIVNVNDGVVADLPQTTAGAVLLTWNITPSVNPPATGADITFQFDAVTQTGGSFNVPPYDTEPIQPWHRTQGYWLASGTLVPLVNIGGNLRTVTGTSLTQFSPYGLSRMSLPLPVKLISFTAVKVNDRNARINWELAACCSRDARFELEKSTDGIRFQYMTTITGSETNRFYEQYDINLSRGITYYRLKATDVDGKVTYSRIVAVINGSEGLYVSAAAPNPVKDATTVVVTLGRKEAVAFTLTDAAGRIARQWQSVLPEGNNNVVVPVQQLGSGIYFLTTTAGTERNVIRFVKE